MCTENNTGLVDSIRDHLREQQRQSREEFFSAWCQEQLNVAPDTVLRLKDGLVADIELQPMRWMRSGVDLITSAKGTVSVRLFNGMSGPPLQTFLPYPVFQAGTEIFLKGMLLAQFDECRAVEQNDYVLPVTREKYQKYLKKLSHNLLQILSKTEEMEPYRTEPNIARFLRIISGVIRNFYYPLIESDSAWGHARYPRRFYDDAKHVGHADAFKSYPEQWPLGVLFQQTMEQVDNLWGITSAIADRVRAARP